jgi:hypothetical protein
MRPPVLPERRIGRHPPDLEKKEVS